ncbi:hypothetical protein OH809_43200 [Streptomyces sp. NBC_00873]|uniref:hypothetical protein n=1 Tax=unclassified Streptomyces TaxID=2593676 RepID=UPI00386A8079|nr:hypothetical protein OH809_00510 [Streptomyces sp. NBC_00873]WSY96840.1 hypothetical protein OH809_43200 [Streptomyces sp. NBC_00873]WTA41387.1 hypothetical protein OH821_00510 [Streptomyces sp. NBC_00842]WTA48510.1 hypothetical protein OH821_43305 [Streptomyces sp. NBC_00842]
MREAYDGYQAAGRLKVPVAAWRWAAASNLVPAANAAVGLGSRAVVEATDAEAMRAALRRPTVSLSVCQSVSSRAVRAA